MNTTKTIRDFLADLSRQKVKLWVDGDQLRLKAPKGVLTKSIVQQIRARKAEIMLFLTRDVQKVDRPPIELIPRTEGEPLPLSYAQQRLWFLDQFEGPSATYNVRSAYRLTGTLAVTALEQAISEMIRRHEVLRTTFSIVDGQPVQKIVPPEREGARGRGGEGAKAKRVLAVVELQHLTDEAEQRAELERLLHQEAQQPFNLAEGPLLRVTLYQLGNTEQVLMLNMHHIISDGWSLGIWWQELDTLYRAFAAPPPSPPQPWEGNERSSPLVLGGTEGGPSSPLPDLSLQYADFAQWQRSWLTGEVLEKQLAYWQEQLAGAPTLLELPTDHARLPLQSFNGRLQRFEIPADLAGQLRDKSVTAGATLFMTLYGAFAVLLSRYSRQEDVVIGTSIANRHYQEIEPLIGFFVNTLALRTDLSGNPTFEQLLDQVRQVTLDAYAHQDIPFEHLVGELVQERNLSHPPLFQVMFELLDSFSAPKSLGECTFSQLNLEATTVKFDMTFILFDGQADGSLRGLLNYNTDLFLEATIQRMIGHYLRLLEGIVQNAQQPINQLPLLTEPETQQLLVEWNDTYVPCPTERCFHELFEAQVERTPDAPAVNRSNDFSRSGPGTTEGGRWRTIKEVCSEPNQGQTEPILSKIAQIYPVSEPSADYLGVRQAPPEVVTTYLCYRELNERANQLAHHLRALGVKPEVVVGVCMERCTETVISLLAIFKAGGVYIPLDPALPQERLSYMLTNSEAKVVLTKSQYASRLSDHHAETLYLDTDWSLIAEQPKHNPINLSTPQNLAYVIYTSGSTGLPKGAMVEQQGMVNHLYTKIIDLKMSAGDRLAETAPQSFDISIWQFLSALLVGGAVHIFDDETVRNPAQLLARTEEEKITILEVVPSLFRFMLDELGTLGPNRPEFSALRWLMLTGEALPPHLCREWFPYYPDIPLINAYGPTECSDDVTHHAIYEAPPPNAVTVPIGRAVPNMRLYILDPYMQPVPVGVLGELYVGGIGVGRGYLNDPERTAKAFMDDPFMPADAGQPHERFYKTGDLVRYRPDGTIEFLGRLDYQVKIRGHRIELGEIEGVLAKHPAVRQCLVIAKENGPADYSLVAYVAAIDSSNDFSRSGPRTTEVITTSAPSVTELRHYLSQTLPDYMIPAAFVTLDAFPLTPNGKVDRKALPEPTRTSFVTLSEENTLVRPQTPTEEVLANIWAEVLGVERIGREENFFELGGHSLLAIQVISRLRQVFQVELSVRVVFESPTIAELAEVIDAARQTEQQLPVPPPILPVPRGEPALLPLSFAQQRLWFLDQLEGPSATYNIPSAFRLTTEVGVNQPSPLQVDALEEALNQLIERHEILRTTFPTINGQPMQRIHRSNDFSRSALGRTTEVVTTSLSELDNLLMEEVKRPFDLAEGPLLRVHLYLLSESATANTEVVLQLTIHHIISDAWSMDVFMRELSALYQAAIADRPSPLAPLPRGEGDLPELAVQYGDFAQWQREWLRGEVLETQLAYWQAQLAHAPTLLDLPTDHPRPLVQTFNGQLERFELDPELTAQLKTLSRRLGASSFMTYYAAFALLMARYSGQEDIVIGTPIANRQYREIEPLIGFFLNTLALRTDLSDNPSFADLVAQVRQVTLDAYAHQDIPFEQLVEELAVERNLSHSPLFQVMFVWLDRSPPAMLGDITMERLPLPAVTAKFDLTLFLGQALVTQTVSLSAPSQTAGLWGMIEYNTDLFERATIERMIGHLRQLLHSIALDAQQPVNQLPLLTEAERQQIVVEWNNTATDYPRDKCIHQLFEQQVERTPDAIAVISPPELGGLGTQLTYRQLNQYANQLAHHLRTLGVGPDVLVGLSLERSLEMMVSVLAILKAGGAYVPLDPAYPQERLTFMQRDAQIKLLLTHSESAVTAAEGTQVLYLDQIGEQLALMPTENPHSGVSPENLLYVIYTSGSTGQPKGVAMPHRPLVNLISWQEGHFDKLSAKQSRAGLNRTLQFTPISFDVSCQELFSTWYTGGTLVLVDDETRRDGEALLDYLNEQRIERLFLPFVALQAIAEYAQHAPPISLREVITAGEQLQITPAIKKWFSQADCTLHNQYGPTESHVITAYTLPKAVDDWTTLPPIGTPIANGQTYILDESLQPVPIGVVGELYLGGDALARGYLHRPDLTEERFIPNPFGPGRIYKTGDLARYLPDHNTSCPSGIEFLGRADHQVKIRGFRVELGEIEARLSQHPAVQEAAVVASDSPLPVLGEGLGVRAGGPQRLVAYVVTGEQRSDLVSELRTSLKAQLPDYMVPAAFVSLDALPLTPSGKINRRALPALMPENFVTLSEAKRLIAPRTPTEEIVAATWAEVLKVEPVSRDSDFFELGGHSLLATQMVSRLREVFRTTQASRVALRVRTIFEAPTVAELAEAIENARTTSQQLPVPPPIGAIERVGDLPLDVPLSFAQQRLWLLNEMTGSNPTYILPMGLRLSGSLNVSALEQAFNEIVRRHEILRTTFPSVEGEPRQRIHPMLTISLSVSKITSPLELGHLVAQAVSLSGAGGTEGRESELRQLLIAEVTRPFDLAAGPLLRVNLYQFAEQEHILLINMHHIISDGWSLSVFWQELDALYRAFAAGQPSPLPELSLQYADFAQWQRNWLKDEVLESQLAYWHRQLANAPTVLELPTDHRRPLVQTFNGSHELFEIPSELAEQVRALSRRHGSTLFMTLYSAFSVLLYRYSGQEDIVIGAPIANRNYREIEPLIGFFVNTLALRADLSGQPSFAELLNRVRQTTLDAYAHQDIPFEQLVTHLNIERQLSHSPLFQVMFAWQTKPLDGVGLAELSVSPVKLGGIVSSKFDLTLELGDNVSQDTNDRSMWGLIEYNTDLFEPATIQRMIGNFKQLLAGIVADPTQAINELPILTPAERQQLLVEWNSYQTAYPAPHSSAGGYALEKSINQLFEEQAARTPDAVAVLFNGAQLTYRELNQRANQLAHHLIKMGLKPEELVGICVERSLDMVIGLLGILKAGGAYLPLDPDYPAERLAFMLDDAQVPILLTQQQFVERLSEQAVQRLSLDSDWPTIAAEKTDNPPNQLGAESLAYVIYTSGSTGRPKGVMVPHRGINRLVNNTNYIEITAQDRMAQASNASFDAATFEIWGALLHGACLVGIPRDVAISPQRLATELKQQEISILFLTTALFNQVVNFAPDAFGHLRYLLFGGEAVDPVAVKKLLDYGPPEHFLHVYGPTENTTYSSWYPIESVPENAVTVPIGIPIANTQFYVLDGQLEPVPVGVPGELYLGGDGLALGYLKRPKLTEERFIPNPFNSPLPVGEGLGVRAVGEGRGGEGARLYKTGDLVRYLPDGNIEFIGRIDHQIKLRGFRIELGEIEAHLSQHPAVQEVTVIMREDQPGQKQLVAYVVAERQAVIPRASGQGLSSANDLRTFLKQKVPDYMVPSAFVLLESLPLNPNGKVDRRALPAPAEVETVAEHYVSPQSDLEKAIAEVWQELLNLPKVGIHDNFFDVGGHSLLAIQIHSTLQNKIAHAKEMSVTDLFRFPTIALLAEHLSKQARHASVARKQTEPSPEAPLLQTSQSRSQARRQALKQRAKRKPRRRKR